MTEVRPFSPTPMDLALVHRLATCQLSMDTATALTRGVNPVEAALLAVVPLADLGFPTLVLREKESGYLGQLRHRTGEPRAHLALLAPIPDQNLSYAPWLQMIEGLVATAGKRGASIVTAEVSETAFAAFEILRKGGFIIYARQTIYQRQPGKAIVKRLPRRVRVRPVAEHDWPQLHLLYGSLVPSLIQRADPMPKLESTRNGGTSLIIESLEDNRRVGYLAMTAGRHGLLVKPLLHPDVFDEAESILESALSFWSKVERLPLYFCVRSYQEWLGTPLLRLGMQELDRQVMFVKYTTVHVHNAVEHLAVGMDAVLRSVVQHVDITTSQE